MRNGKVYELQMQERPTKDLESSSLPTPTTRDYKDGSADHKRNGKVQTDTVARAIFSSGEIKLFNTPTTMDAKATNNPVIAQKFLDEGRQTCLTYDIAAGRDLEIILPTPTTNGNDRKGPGYASAGILQALEIANGILPKEYRDWDHAREKIKWAEPIALLDKTITDWGKFEPAIRRWEAVLRRIAPAPTKPDGKEGNHRLSSSFSEWMMGLPDGWITDVGLTRNEELKLAGNGVVPQQAELALKILLENTPPR
jgi:DNA (cytosine-5)-methyltransferase 1